MPPTGGHVLGSSQTAGSSGAEGVSRSPRGGDGHNQSGASGQASSAGGGPRRNPTPPKRPRKKGPNGGDDDDEPDDEDGSGDGGSDRSSSGLPVEGLPETCEFLTSYDGVNTARCTLGFTEIIPCEAKIGDLHIVGKHWC